MRISNWVSQSDWLIIPTPTEADLSVAKNRPDANIYFGLNGEIDLGLVCNTLASIWKMENILLHYHTAERDKFLELLSRLDNEFYTEVGRKIYDHYWGQSPRHTVDISYRSNSMTENRFRRLFSKAHEIHEEGKELTGKNANVARLLPTLSLASTNVTLNKEAFIQKLTALKPLYEISLAVRTGTELRKEGMGDWLICPKCGWGPVRKTLTRTCPECKTSLVAH